MPIIGSSASPKGVPSTPTIGTATPGNGSASVTFTAPSFSKLPITSYTVTSSPGGFTGTGSSSPITVSGLTNGTAYTFTVRASHATGQSVASSASNSVTPVAPINYSLSQTFNASGTYTVPSGASRLAAYVFGGGAGGGNSAGGGGGGGAVAFSGLSVTPGQTYSVTVGSGGGSDTNGGTSLFGSAATANGGGAATSAGGTASSNAPTVTTQNGATGGAAGGYSVNGSPGSAGGAEKTLTLNATGLVSYNGSGGGGGGGGGGYADFSLDIQFGAGGAGGSSATGGNGGAGGNGFSTNNGRSGSGGNAGSAGSSSAAGFGNGGGGGGKGGVGVFIDPPPPGGGMVAGAGGAGGSGRQGIVYVYVSA